MLNRYSLEQLFFASNKDCTIYNLYYPTKSFEDKSANKFSSQYQIWKNEFEKNNVNILSQHWPYDFAIEL